jgi:hypothetical protein
MANSGSTHLEIYISRNNVRNQLFPSQLFINTVFLCRWLYNRTGLEETWSSQLREQFILKGNNSLFYVNEYRKLLNHLISPQRPREL